MKRALIGHGLTSCATCDGAFYRNVPVAVIGGGDSACEEATFLTRFASKVYLIHRRDTLRASKIMADRALANPKIKPIWNSTVTEYLTDEKGEMRAVKLKNLVTGEESELELKCVFVAIGHVPNSAFLGDLVDRTRTATSCRPRAPRTKTPGLFAAGDVADHVYRQAITAAGQGCAAALEAERYSRALAVNPSNHECPPRMNRRDAIAMLLAGFSSSRLLHAASSGTDAMEAAARIIQSQVEAKVLESAVLHVQRGDLIFQRAFGKAASPDAIFLLASITKTMTAAGVMVLADREKLRLTDHVGNTSRSFPKERAGTSRSSSCSRTRQDFRTRCLTTPRCAGVTLHFPLSSSTPCARRCCSHRERSITIRAWASYSRQKSCSASRRRRSPSSSPKKCLRLSAWTGPRWASVSSRLRIPSAARPNTPRLKPEPVLPTRVSGIGTAPIGAHLDHRGAVLMVQRRTWPASFGLSFIQQASCSARKPRS